MKNVIAMLLAGGHGSRLMTLSRHRAKPAVPFGGIYRIIDFTLSCIMRSNIPIVGVMTQYRPYSLMDHISNGEAWGFVGRRRLAKILPPFVGDKRSDWYAGTADALFQNLPFVERFKEIDTVLVLSGDHIYNMDYREVVRQHQASKAEVTIACQEVPWDQTRHFGIMVTDEHKRIVDFMEKPKERPPSNLASLGIYVFNKDSLIERLRADADDPNSQHDFGHDIIPGMIADGSTYAYRFEGYWRDVGTVDSYWEAHMDILRQDQTLDMNRWEVRTNSYSYGYRNIFPARAGNESVLSNSIVGLGSVVEGRVANSLLSPGVHVGRGAQVENSILMHNTVIGDGAIIRNAVIDKQCVIGEGAVIGEGDNIPNHNAPDKLYTGLTLLGKKAQVPARARVGRNVVIGTHATVDLYPVDGCVESGASVGYS